ncbi:MAG: hypothetical protein PHT31_03080 [Candidatus Omnitrophica bacterium]|nr:hypothetical protein [Candidatus Omnitrophota bacterium]MDD5653129.1 hypothetical protein [Candidatus Omnitrophota bacterium]
MRKIIFAAALSFLSCFSSGCLPFIIGGAVGAAEDFYTKMMGEVR